MPRTIDEEALSSPNMQILDLGNPPTKAIPYAAFPKAIYLHPKDKSKQHRTKVVHSEEELEAAEEKGWKTKPHIPIQVEEDLSVEFEAEEAKRGPGRPKAA